MSVKPTDKRGRHQEGQALVEFALVLLFVILPITAVLIDGALLLFTQVSVTNAAREGARAGSIYQCGTAGISCTIDPIQTYDVQVANVDGARAQYVDNQAEPLLRSLISYAQCVRTITYEPCSGQLCISSNLPPMGNTYRELNWMNVKIDCPHRLFFGLVGTGVVTVSAASTMRIEPGGVQSTPTPTP